MSRRIILVLTVFPQLSETFIVSKFKSLLDKGWDIHVVCNHHDQKNYTGFPQLSETRNLSSRVHQTWPISPRWLPLLTFPLAFIACALMNPVGLASYLARGFKKHGFKVFKRFYVDSRIIALKPALVHFEFGATAVERADIGYLLGCKMVVSFRGYDLNFSGLDHADYYADVWKYADGFHFLGEDLHQRALRRGLPPEKTFVLIPPAIDTEFFAPKVEEQAEEIGTATRPLQVLSVGRLEWKKGYEYAFQGVELLRKSGIQCEYHIIGDGEYREPLLFSRYQLDLDDCITFLGAQPRACVRDELERADVFLHAAVSEGFCNAVLEAQSMRVPVVTTDADGLSENVENEVTGFVVHRRDPAALAGKLAALATDPELQARMGKAGRVRVQKYFRLDDQILAFEKFYLSNLVNDPH